MEDGTEEQVNQEAEAVEEPKAEKPELTREGVDAYVKARIDKQNAKHAAETAELESKLAEAIEAAEKAKAEMDAAVADRDALKAQAERSAEVAANAARAGVDAAILARMSGDTPEEIAANADALAASMAARTLHPSVPDAGPGGGKSTAPESIESIKDPVERVIARASNLQAYTV